MKHMFAGDPWYNGQGQQGGVQGMGFRPGPVQIAMVRPAPQPQPTFGGMPQTAPMHQQQPLLAQAAPQQYQPPAPSWPPRPQAPAQGQAANGRIPMGSKANCPVCRNFGG